MKTILIVVGKTQNKHLQALIQDYVERIGHFTPFGVEVVPELKNTKGLNADLQKQKEGKALLERLTPGDHVVLLDEKGRERRSVDFARYADRQLGGSMRRLVFIIGGPYGFSSEVYDRADEEISLSLMTFSHQMIRLLFVEQFYRAMTITAGLPYHHE